MNAKKWMMIVLAIIVIGGGVWWFTSDSDDSADDTADETTEVAENDATTEDTTTDNGDDEAVATTVIVYTDNGFEPATVGPLPVGTTVTFENASSTDNFEPASDPHPTHTDLGGFDSIDPVPVGETYSFTFDEPGEWGFHNHLQPSDVGVVIIE